MAGGVVRDVVDSTLYLTSEHPALKVPRARLIGIFFAQVRVLSLEAEVISLPVPAPEIPEEFKTSDGEAALIAPASDAHIDGWVSDRILRVRISPAAGAFLDGLACSSAFGVTRMAPGGSRCGLGTPYVRGRINTSEASRQWKRLRVPRRVIMQRSVGSRESRATIILT